MVWASGGGGKCMYLTKNPFSLGEGIFLLKLTKKSNLTKKLFFFLGGGGGGGGGGLSKGMVCWVG